MATSPAGNARDPVDSSKRQASDAPPEAFSAKRRAPRACLSCRSRKVRCDVLRGDNPCTNCRLDGLQCILSDSNRGKAKSTSIHCDEHAPLTNSEQADDIPVSLTFEAPNGVNNTSEPSEEDRISSSRTPEFNMTRTHHSISSSTPGSIDPQTQKLPRYIRPLPPHIGVVDFEYLTKKDALTIPTDALRVELLQNFVQYVHPFMPLLDLDDFLTPIAHGDRGRPISLLLFQAVMFVSVAFVSDESLHEAGFGSRKEARKTFFRRVRLLYGLDCEPDRISLLQALLLMTYWYESPQDEKDTWHWMGISLGLAQILGFHRNPEYLNISVRAKRLQRRIWWSCLMRDRLLALGIRRPARIRHEDFSVPMLTLDDFETAPLPQDLLSSIGESSFAEDLDSRKTVALACIEMARLCVCIGNVLFSQYSILGNVSIGADDDTMTMVTPRHSNEQVQAMSKCDIELSDWYQSLNSGCRYQAYDIKPARDQGDNKRIIWLHQALLHMIYLTTMTTLHRPRALQSYSASEDEGAGVRISRSKVTEAAVGITEIAYDLIQKAQLRYLSTSSIPAILWATLIHLLNIRSAKEDVRSTSIGRFYQCMQALEELREMYASADHCLRFLEIVIKKTDVHIPMLGIRTRPRSASKISGAAHFPARSMAPLQRSASFATHGIRPNDVANGVISFSSLGHESLENGYADTVFGPPASVFPRGTLRQDSNNSNRPSEEDMHAGPQIGDWNDIDLGDSLHQALIDFDTNPGSFSTTSTGKLYTGHRIPGMGSLGGYI